MAFPPENVNFISSIINYDMLIKHIMLKKLSIWCFACIELNWIAERNRRKQKKEEIQNGKTIISIKGNSYDNSGNIRKTNFKELEIQIGEEETKNLIN